MKGNKLENFGIGTESEKFIKAEQAIDNFMLEGDELEKAKKLAGNLEKE